MIIIVFLDVANENYNFDLIYFNPSITVLLQSIFLYLSIYLYTYFILVISFNGSSILEPS